MSARLFTEVREKRGLCYSVWAQLPDLQGSRQHPLLRRHHQRTRPGNARRDPERLRRLERRRQPEEVERVQAGLKSSVIMQEESTSARAGALASDWYYLGRVRPLEEIQAAIDGLTPAGDRRPCAQAIRRAISPSSRWGPERAESSRVNPRLRVSRGRRSLRRQVMPTQAASATANPQAGRSPSMPFHHHVLPNGLTIVGEISPSARSVAVGFFVRTGSRDETPEVSGVSHFLEHMVFKGTPHRTPLEVNLRFRPIGASYNAFTSEENTVFYAAILPEYLPQAVDILADILRPSLRERGLRHGEEGHHRRDRHVRRSADVVAPTTTPRRRSSPTIRSATASSASVESITALRATRCTPISTAATSLRTSPSRPPATSPGPTWSR